MPEFIPCTKYIISCTLLSIFFFFLSILHWLIRVLCRRNDSFTKINYQTQQLQSNNNPKTFPKIYASPIVNHILKIRLKRFDSWKSKFLGFDVDINVIPLKLLNVLLHAPPLLSHWSITLYIHMYCISSISLLHHLFF